MSDDRLLLILESTCDETAAAVVSEQLEVRGSALATQHELHERFAGVVPEIASRAHVEAILPVVDEALGQAGIELDQIAAIAVATTPGLAGSLLVGLVAAKTLAAALDVPLVAFNHLEAHIYACQMASEADVFPCVGLVVSGGHTSLYRCESPLEFELLGATIDDAAGEAFDKVASMLDLGYPGGPAVERAAASGNAGAFALPRSLLGAEDGLDFSFSGLKTAVRYKIVGPGQVDFQQLRLDGQLVADLAASFQAAVVDVLVEKSMRALTTTGLPRLCVGGGVAANTLLRTQLQERCAQSAHELHIAPLELCTDNAVMGAIALERWRAGLVEPLTLDVVAGPLRK
mgnify:CR=1 FL=1